MKTARNLVLVLGDQLDERSFAFDHFDKQQDAVWMAENEEEITYVPTHKKKIVFFLSAMRHLRDELISKQYTVLYHELQADPKKDRGRSFKDIITVDVKRLKPQQIIAVQPGDFRVKRMLEQAAEALSVPIVFTDDKHFYCSQNDFISYVKGKKSPRMEYFYRFLRQEHDILLDKNKEPVGGEWNLDEENRETLKRDQKISYRPIEFKPDKITDNVIELVKKRFAKHPGMLNNFTLPVVRTDALKMLDHFIQKGLPNFGTYEDAMLTGEPFLFHSRLSALLNVKLLNPKECVQVAVEAYEKKKAPLNSVEGFIRQILGWREFMRGIYWMRMPDYSRNNYLDHQERLPRFYWDGNTRMNCMNHCVNNVLERGYAHHIQRLMVMGLFALQYGVHPMEFHRWHMALYIDAIDWVSLPNTLGMSQYGDGGIAGTKPYCATGNYINRMSDYCKKCPYDYQKSAGDKACPFSTLYYDFLDRHYERLKPNKRLAFAFKQLEKKRGSKGSLKDVQLRAESLRDEWAKGYEYFK